MRSVLHFQLPLFQYNSIKIAPFIVIPLVPLSELEKYFITFVQFLNTNNDKFEVECSLVTEFCITVVRKKSN